eukprot:scaffold2088_cov399-Prasinococcus_capsulatus_cf.AAC.53
MPSAQRVCPGLTPADHCGACPGPGPATRTPRGAHEADRAQFPLAQASRGLIQPLPVPSIHLGAAHRPLRSRWCPPDTAAPAAAAAAAAAERREPRIAGWTGKRSVKYLAGPGEPAGTRFPEETGPPHGRGRRRPVFGQKRSRVAAGARGTDPPPDPRADLWLALVSAGLGRHPLRRIRGADPAGRGWQAPGRSGGDESGCLFRGGRQAEVAHSEGALKRRAVSSPARRPPSWWRLLLPPPPLHAGPALLLAAPPPLSLSLSLSLSRSRGIGRTRRVGGTETGVRRSQTAAVNLRGGRAAPAPPVAAPSVRAGLVPVASADRGLQLPPRQPYNCGSSRRLAQQSTG